MADSSSRLALARATGWSAGAVVVKLAVGLLVVRLLAVQFGPDGLGRAANLMTFVTVLGVLAGGGIANGITKYLAEHRARGDQERRHLLLGTSATIVLAVSAVVALGLWWAAEPLGRVLIGGPEGATTVRAAALLQLGIAYGNFFLAVLKGRSDARGTALSVMGGSLLGLLGYWLSAQLGGYPGALIGLVLIPALLVAPAALTFLRHDPAEFGGLRPRWDPSIARALARFGVMAALTAVIMPACYILIRNQLAATHGWHEVGLWQGVSKLSDAYVQLITAQFTVYLLPTLSGLRERAALGAEVLRSMRFVMSAVAVLGVGLWLLRDTVIALLYTAEFAPMGELFGWQLSGDVFKVGSYVIGYLVIAKASLRWYVVAELSQFTLLTAFASWLVPEHGALGAAQAYLVTYACYFSLCLTALLIYRRPRGVTHDPRARL